MKEENVVIVLNSPAGSGKDVVAEHLAIAHGFQWVELKKRAVEIVRAVFGVSELEWEQMYTRDRKDTPHWKLKVARGGKWMSPRQALIYISEEVVKPQFGEGYFARCTLEAMQEGMDVVVSDAGFIDEVITITDVCKNAVKVSIDRDGYTYEGDSRSSLPDIMFRESYILDNNGTKEELYEQVDELVNLIKESMEK